MTLETVAAGFTIGLLVGLTGIGGGALMTPYLLLALHMPPITAVGTDMVFAFITKAISAAQHRRQRTLWLKPAFYIAIGSVPSSFFASLLVAKYAKQGHRIAKFLPQILGALLIMVAILVAARALGLLKARNENKEHWPKWWQGALLGATLGSIVGITSIGSGTLLVAVMLLCFAIPAEHLVGLNVLTGAILAFFPSLTYAYHGFVAWQLLLTILIGAMPGAVIGSRLVTKTPTKAIRLILSFLVLLAGIRLLA